MLEFHKDKERYFNMQYQTSKLYIYPFVASCIDFSRSLDVLELGCAEAGVLKAFIEEGHNCTGIELSEKRIDLAKQFLADEFKNNKIRFSSSNLYDLIPGEDGHLYDLIILKDVIEHIPNQEEFIPYLSSFLKPNGKIFFGFPPWLMPFGGHQQLCRNKWLRKWGWMHILPRPIYKAILSMGENEQEVIDEMMKIYDSGISIERFNRICRNTGHRVILDKHWLFNPIYKWKFGLEPKTVLSPFRNLPYIKNFYTTAYYAVVEKHENC